MRLNTLAAAAAALWLAAPAAAQHDPEALALEAVQQVAANMGDAEDYTLVLAYESVRVPVYVYRDGDGWSVATPPELPLAEMMAAAVVWPAMLDASADAKGEALEAAAMVEEALYLGTEPVEDRPAHVLAIRTAGGEGLPDSMRLYVDTGSRQIVRMVVAGRMEEDEDEFLRQGAQLWMSLDLADYRATDGVVVPMRMRIRMRMELEIPAKERQSMREDVARTLSQLDSLPPEEAAEIRIMAEVFGRLLADGEFDLPITVEEVRVNSGPPEWLKAATLGDPGA